MCIDFYEDFVLLQRIGWIMNIIKFAQSFKKGVNVLPARVPVLPSPENLAKLSKEDAEKIFEEWEQGWERKHAEDKVAFEYALARITMCFSLHHMSRSLNFFAVGNSSSLTKFEHVNCYSWCPYEKWFVSNQKFIDSFEMYR